MHCMLAKNELHKNFAPFRLRFAMQIKFEFASERASNGAKEFSFRFFYSKRSAYQSAAQQINICISDLAVFVYIGGTRIDLHIISAREITS